MIRAFLVFAICLEHVASYPNWGSQASASSGYQPQNVVTRQQGYQYPVPNYSTYGVPHVQNTFARNWPQQAAAQPRVNQIAQPSVYYPHYENIQAIPQNHQIASQYLPHQVYLPPQDLQLAYLYGNNVYPSVQPTVPVHYNNPANVKILHENLNWLAQHYPSLQNTIAKAESQPNPLAKPLPGVASAPPVPKTSPQVTKQPALTPASGNGTIPQIPVNTATATATAGGPPGSNTTVATATVAEPQTIPPEITEAINEANEAIINLRNISEHVINNLYILVEAAKKAATAKADTDKPFDVNSTSTLSSNPDLNNLSKLYKDSQDEIKAAYAVFSTLQDKVDDLVKKVENNANSTADSQSPSADGNEESMPPVDSANNENSNSNTTQDSQEQPAPSTNEDEEPSVEEKDAVEDADNDENEEEEPST